MTFLNVFQHEMTVLRKTVPVRSAKSWTHHFYLSMDLRNVRLVQLRRNKFLFEITRVHPNRNIALVHFATKKCDASNLNFAIVTQILLETKNYPRTANRTTFSNRAFEFSKQGECSGHNKTFEKFCLFCGKISNKILEFEDNFPAVWSRLQFHVSRGTFPLDILSRNICLGFSFGFSAKSFSWD